MTEKQRHLNSELELHFKSGELTALVEALKIMPQFMLNLRDTKAQIYYKTAPVMTISFGNKNKVIKYEINTRYIEHKSKREDKGYISYLEQSYNQYLNPNTFSGSKDEIFNKANFDITKVASWVHLLTNLANYINEYKKRFDAPAMEKEIQQRIVFENNVLEKKDKTTTTTYTDYFVFDTEYAEGNGRFDAIAIYWPKSEQLKQNYAYNPQLALIEIKVGEGALAGKSGISDHWNKTLDFINKDSDRFYKDMKQMIRQLSDFGLLNIPPKMAETLSNPECNFNKMPKMIFMLANLSSVEKLLPELDKIEEQKDKIDLRFATSSFMGYGLYDEGMLTLDEFKALLTKKCKLHKN